MVGFVRESVKEEDNVVSQSKLKASANDSESFKFDFDCYSTGFDELSVPSAKLPLDFDIFEDWIGEMQEPVTEVETGNGVNSCLENPVGSCVSDFTQDMKDLEKTGSVNVGCGGTDESTMRNGEDIGTNDNVLKSCGMDNVMRPESNVVTKQNGIPRDESCIRVLDHESNVKLDGLGCSIEEGLEKVSLVGNEGGMVVCANRMSETEIASVGVEDDSDSDSGSESESEATTSSSSSSSSSSESDDDDDEVASMVGEKLSKSNEQKVDMEEGEIVGSDTEKMVSRSDDDDADDDEDSKVGEIDEVFEDGDDEDISDIPKGPIKSKNELVVLPPVPPVTVTLQPGHQILPVGAVISTLGAQVVVEGSEEHSPLSEGSILWISETRSPLGLVDEIFGPVKNPFYIVRFNSESEVPSGLRIGSLIGFVQDFVDHVLNDETIYQKGYDASGDNDEELMDEVEFSDDEKEAEYKRIMKMSKRGNTNQGSGNKKNKNLKNRDRIWTKDQPLTSQSLTVEPSQPNRMTHYVRAPVPSTSQVNMPGPPLSGPNFSVGPTSFPEQAQQAGLLLNGLMMNMMQFQQQPNVPMPGSFQMNGMPWQMAAIAPLLQQQLLSQIPQHNLAPPQQQRDLSQLGSSGSPLGQVNYAGGPNMATNSPWFGPLGSNRPNQMNYAGGPTMFTGPISSDTQGGQSGNFQSALTFPMNADVRPSFNQGFSSGGGRGRGSFHPRGGRGRFDSRRGRH